MPSQNDRLTDYLRAGVRLHSQGLFEQAKDIFEQALSLSPDHPQALALLGTTLLQLGETAAALDRLERAARKLRNDAWVIGTLAQAYFVAGRYRDAEDFFRKANRLDPAEPQLSLGIANAMAMQSRLQEAEDLLRRLSHRYPDHPLVWFNLGNTLRDQARLPDARSCYTKALDIEPDLIDARNNLGSAFHSEFLFEDAKREYRACIAAAPEYVAARFNLASVLIDNGEFGAAEVVGRDLVARAAESATAHTFLGAALNHQGKLREALEQHRTAAAIAPDDAHCAQNYAGALASVGEIDAALAEFARAQALQPDSAKIRYERATALLGAGRLREGWSDYAYRPAFRSTQVAHAGLELTRVLPAPAAGAHVTLLAEQGLGDELFFLRFANALRAAGARITYRANRKLHGMLARAEAIAELIDPETPPHPESTVMLVGDLPNALANRAPTGHRAIDTSANPAATEPVPIPAPLKLTPLPTRLDAMRDRLSAAGNPPYIGVTWRGGTPPAMQRLAADWGLFKQIGIEPLAAALSELPGTLVVLQRHPEGAEIERFARAFGRPVHDLSAINETLEDMLALLALMDDYIGVSNTNMHLRAGVGRTARVLVPGPPEWRWMTSGDRSPWFPGFTVYRQSYDGDWDAALAKLRQDLHASFGRQPPAS